MLGVLPQWERDAIGERTTSLLTRKQRDNLGVRGDTIRISL